MRLNRNAQMKTNQKMRRARAFFFFFSCRTNFHCVQTRATKNPWNKLEKGGIGKYNVI